MNTVKLKPSTTYRAIVGRILAHDRGQRDQAEIAKRLGLTQSAWSRIETGASSISVEQLKMACDALGTRADSVLLRADQAIEFLQRKGVKVVMQPEDATAAVVGIAALGALLLAILNG